jgi:hypothetical protein
MKLLLDGSKMRGSIFFKKFLAIVGVSWVLSPDCA